MTVETRFLFNDCQRNGPWSPREALGIPERARGHKRQTRTSEFPMASCWHSRALAIGASRTTPPVLAGTACAGTRNFGHGCLYRGMNKSPSPETAARLERRRLAAEDGSKAVQEVLDAAIAVRANMARLRALRLAKEAKGVIEPDQSRGPQAIASRRSKRGGRKII